MKTITVICIALLSALGSVCWAGTPAASTTAPVGTTVVECPPLLQNGQLSGVVLEYRSGSGVPLPTQVFLDAIPKGWDWHMDHPYSGQVYEIVSNEVIEDRLLFCRYGLKIKSAQSNAIGNYFFATIRKSIPVNQSCTAVNGFKFQCQIKAVNINKK